MTPPDPTKPLPPLKPGLEAIQIEHEGKPMVVLRDQEGITSETIAISLSGFLVALMLDGRNTIADVQSLFAKNTGSLLQAEEVQAMIAQLDQAGLLETDRLQEKRRQVMRAFHENPARQAIHLPAYPSDSLELAAYLGKFFQDPKGPGRQVSARPEGPAPVGLFAPHIDLERGGPAYAWAYQTLGSMDPPDLIVALGVAHMSPHSPWTATKKTYETPYGAMAVSPELYDEFAASLWYSPTVDEGVHRTEHSLEFQALWLRYLWRDKTPPWLPVLCSSFERFCPDRAPSTVETVDAAIQAWGAKLKKRQDAGQRILILAGVDMAHVGPRFGDELELTPELEKKLEAEDRASLAPALKRQADPFYLSVIKDGHWRKWCGLSAMYTSLRLIEILSPASEGKLLTYGQAPDPMGGIVSFTSVVFPRA